jgi:sugar O-acyltransferase (sialic acid O-acetyltransferase NeuD family)
MKKIAILGASCHGKILADVASILGWDEIVFFDDAWPELTANSHWSVSGNTSKLIEHVADFDGVIVAIGNNAVRLNKTQLLQRIGAKVVTLIHPKAIISQFSFVGIGSFVGAGSVIQVDAEVGDACIINTNAVIEHDCIIKDGVHLSPLCALAGGVTVSYRSWIGIGASVKQLVQISKDVTVGAGSVVVRDITSGLTVVGNPARPILKNKP